MIRTLVKHGTTVILAVVVLFVFGLNAYRTLPRESNPDITIPVVMVTTPYPGVSPKDVEGLVSIPIENEIASVKDIKDLTSVSAEGVSLVYVEFEPDTVIEDALQRVRDRVSRARAKLPDDVEESEIREISFNDIPILMVNISGDVGEVQLKALAERLEDGIARIPGVLDATVAGGLEREIQVQVDPLRLAHYGLPLRDVVTAIGNENVNIPGGEVGIGPSTVLLRVPGEITDPRQLEEVAIKRVGDRPVFVRDVATVVDTFEERKSYARMNGEPSVSISVTKRAGANIIEVASATKALVEEQAASWPDGVSYRVLADQSEHIADMVVELQNNIVTALLLVLAVLVFFMGWRSSLFVAVAIPLSMLASFLVLEVLGFTLNMVVLFSLILALGMLVDNAIVVVENVYRHMEEGKDPWTAAIDGTNEVAMAVAASTATTVAAFGPLIFWTGIMGEFMGFLPKTVIIVLVASLVVAVAVLPVFLSRLLKQTPRIERVAELDDPVLQGRGRFMKGYRAVLEWSIRWRYLSLGLGFATLIFTFLAFALLNHGTEFFPEADPNRAVVGIQLSEGADLEETDRVVRRVEELLATEPNVDVFVAEPGVKGDNALLGSNTVANAGRITIDFLPDRNSAGPGEMIRVESTRLTVDRIRDRVAAIPGARITVEPERMGPPVGDPIAIEVSGDDFHEVGALALALRREVAKVEGVTDLRDDYRVGRPEMRLRVDRGAAKRIGVSTGEIGDAVRAAVAGTVASALREGEEEHDIRVLLAPMYREDLQSVLDIRLPGRLDTSPDTFPVPLSAVAAYDLVGGSGSIKHIDQDLVVTITADVAEGFNENAVREEVRELLAGYDLPDGFHLDLTGADAEQQQATAFLSRAFAIAVALILLVLVTQFDSVSMPLIILASVVMSLVGVLWGLILTGTPFGIVMTGIGVISLAGVVVNNAIVLLDYVQQLRDRGETVHDALIRAGMTRFRPVMLTAVTTILGLLPMALGISFDFTRFRLVLFSVSAAFWGPMAVAVIFGLAFATVLTLVLVPTMYSIQDDVVRAWAWLKQRARRPAEAAAKVLALGIGLGVAASAEAVTLEEAWRAAEDHSTDLGLLREQTIQAETMRGKAWSLLSPQVSVGATYTINEFPIAFDPADMIPKEVVDTFGIELGEPMVIQEKEYWQGDVTVSQTLFSGSAIPLLKGAYHLTKAARLDAVQSRQQLRAAVARTVYGLAANREAVEVAELAVGNAESQLELARRQVEAGSAPRRAMLQAELALSRARRDALQVRESLAAVEEAFARLTGLPRETAVEVAGPVEVPADLDAAWRIARSERPDLLAAERRVAAARLEKTATGLGWLPEVNGNFSYIYNQNTGFADDPTFWTITLGGRWILWDGGMRTSQLKESASKVRSAELVSRARREGVEEEVRTAWERHRRATQALEVVEREVALAEESLALAERGFEAGLNTWLEVEEAQLGLTSARLNAIRERAERDLAAIALTVAMGGY